MHPDLTGLQEQIGVSIPITSGQYLGLSRSGFADAQHIQRYNLHKMPLIQPNKPRYYMGVGSSDNLGPRGLHHSGLHGDVRIPFAAHDPKPEMAAGGIIPGLPREPELREVNRDACNRNIPLWRNSPFSGKPVSHRLFYSGK